MKQMVRRLARSGGLLRGEAGFGGEIVSFEPAAASFAALRAALAGDRRWRGHGYALGRSAGTATLRRFAESELNTLLAPSRYGVERFPTMAGPLSTQTVEVRLFPVTRDRDLLRVIEFDCVLRREVKGGAAP
jgi:hypothetical protein